MNIIKLILYTVGVSLLVRGAIFFNQKSTKCLWIAIANYGPHPSLYQVIHSFKKGMEELGYKENREICYLEKHINFDLSLMSQMFFAIKSKNPDATLVLSTPLAQGAKKILAKEAVFFSVVTNPVDAGIIPSRNQSEEYITGVSDEQSMEALLDFVKSILPSAKRMGLLYSLSERNDLALQDSAQEACLKKGFELESVPIHHSTEIPNRLLQLTSKIDFLYVGPSGTIQPSLPLIVTLAEKNRIPVINMSSKEVEEHSVFASFGVDFEKLGTLNANQIHAFLKGKSIKEIPPLYPELSEHIAFISEKRAKSIGYQIPSDIKWVKVIYEN